MHQQWGDALRCAKKNRLNCFCPAGAESIVRVLTAWGLKWGYTSYRSRRVLRQRVYHFFLTFPTFVAQDLSQKPSLGEN